VERANAVEAVGGFDDVAPRVESGPKVVSKERIVVNDQDA
jgi:hypothetical protein